MVRARQWPCVSQGGRRTCRCLVFKAWVRQNPLPRASNRRELVWFVVAFGVLLVALSATYAKKKDNFLNRVSIHWEQKRAPWADAFQAAGVQRQTGSVSFVEPGWVFFGETAWSGAPQGNNVIGVQLHNATSASLATIAGAPLDVIPQPAWYKGPNNVYYEPLGGFEVPGQPGTIAMWSEARLSGSFFGTHVGYSLVEISTGTQPLRVTHLVSGNDTGVVTAPYFTVPSYGNESAPAHFYFFDLKCRGWNVPDSDNHVCLSRVLRAASSWSLPVAYEFYGGGSSNDFGATTASTPLLFDGCQGSLSVLWSGYLQHYVAVCPQAISRTLTFRVAPSLHGSWSDTAELLTVPGDVGSGFHGVIKYPMVHASLSEDNGKVIYVSYQLLGDNLPHFARVEFHLK